MKFSLASTFTGLSLLLSQVAGNTPDLCTEDIENLRLLKPSECDPTGRVGPDITVGSTVYNNDEAHFVIGSPKTKKKPKKPKKGGNRNRDLQEDLSWDEWDDNDHQGGKIRRLKKGKKGKKGKKPVLMVYLPGTTDWPGLSSCLIQAAAATGNPTIGLTYGYLSRGDSFRNTRCASLENLDDQVECLTEQHNDAIFGGTYGAERIYSEAEFWAPVDPLDSIVGRLGLLLMKLHELYPKEGWNHYYKKPKQDYPATPRLNWKLLAFMGHSQGAGHAAFLAQIKKLGGAVMISGPQDECEGCPANTPFWIDEPYKTKSVTAFAHGDATESFLEPSLPVMEDNWNRMAKTETISWDYPVSVVDTGAYTTYDVCNTPIVSFLAPSAMSPCGRKGHCSTALDDSAPVLSNTSGEDVYIFAMNIWTEISDVAKC
jgi:hypothetical protein